MKLIRLVVGGNRVLMPGSLLIASSPNRASLGTRIRLFGVRRIFELPEGRAVAKAKLASVEIVRPMRWIA
jgi:hypothetical protein